jgi:hypothetical protein
MAKSPDLPRNINLFDTIKEIRAPKSQTDTGWVYVGRFVDFGSPLNDPGTDEMSPPFLNKWKNRPGTRMAFRKTEEGKTEIVGDIFGGVDDTVVCVIPLEYRPDGLVRVQVLTSEFDITVMEVRTNGEVVVVRSDIIRSKIEEMI